MVTGGHSFIQVINKSKMGIMEYIRFLHDTDTPVKNLPRTDIAGRMALPDHGGRKRLDGKPTFLA